MQEKPGEDMNQGVDASAVLLSDEIVSFIESGTSIVLGVVGAGGRAQTGRALAARVIAPSTIRVIYAAEGNAAVTATARSEGPIAVTFSAPLSHRTLQMKGYACRSEVVDADDLDCTARQTLAFAGVLAAIGLPPGFVQAFHEYRESEPLVLSFLVQAAFEQTPGPGAGRSI